MEFGFELALCAWLERHTDWLPARQLGAAVADPGGRVMDVVGVVPGPEFDDRAAITEDAVPPRAVESDVGVGRAVDPREAFDCGSDARDRAVERAVEAGFFERERRDGRSVVRQTARYPAEWFDRLVGVENKPDLDAPGDLERQLHTALRAQRVDQHRDVAVRGILEEQGLVLGRIALSPAHAVRDLGDLEHGVDGALDPDEFVLLVESVDEGPQIAVRHATTVAGETVKR